MSVAEKDDDIDFAAWDVPEAPTGIADGVLARMAATDARDVTDLVERVPERSSSRRSRAWIIGAAAAATLVVAAAVGFIVMGTERAAPTSGRVVAERAQTLSLDSVRAELDAGARVTWRRQGGALHVEQQAGVAAWRVSGEERLVIDAGATVASVEAQGESVGVEFKMNQADVRVLGGSALTAAAVAMVTVTVYEGHVRVTGSQGQPTVIVQPGSTYTVTSSPPPAPAPAPVVGASMAGTAMPTVVLTAGESAAIRSMQLPLAIEFISADACGLDVDGARQHQVSAQLSAGAHRYTLTCGDSTYSGGLHVTALTLPVPELPVIAWTGSNLHVRGVFGSDVSASISSAEAYTSTVSDDGTFDIETSSIGSPIVLRVQQGRALQYYVLDVPDATVTASKTTGALPDTLDRKTVMRVVLDAKARFATCAKKPGKGTTVFAADVDAAGHVRSARVVKTFDREIGDCIIAVVKTLEFPPARSHSTFELPVEQDTCDPEQLREAAMSLIANGEHAAALAKLDESLACQDDPYVLQLAFMEACNAHDSASAQRHFASMTPSQQTRFAEICERSKTDYKSVIPAGMGQLNLEVAPAATQILVDGASTGKTGTRASVLLEPGKHKVTFVIGDDRFTYAVKIVEGETAFMKKNLE